MEMRALFKLADGTEFIYKGCRLTKTDEVVEFFERGELHEYLYVVENKIKITILIITNSILITRPFNTTIIQERTSII
jgi:hypothetical protein